jgi:hypothetical protein
VLFHRYLLAIWLAMTAYVARLELTSTWILDALTLYAALVVTTLYVWQFQGVYTWGYDGVKVTGAVGGV